ncbi:exodeoxyribonuclease VII large subunit [Catalinimonas niigatensis]|uniref:exodeoxyribonuclease VII large subunit n=1 Tax=Catalinimonas niigatensis TaxID=1397264 RepID=UPI002665C18C|nr:exodeoxyribonuclease VII large subunit [Catalinimonas niigatensis]WPP50656.1 exodeoxyribonuclease VII large subunit [Catalinimonas niigatensis]
MSYLSLFELNKLVKHALSNHLEPSYWVVAEIGEIRLTQKGHCYLELIEKDSQQLLAKTRATIWSYTYRNLNGWFEAITGESLKGGMNILCQVEVAYHEVYGISLNIKDIDANFTLGERARKKQEVLNRLADEGVVEMNKALLLPTVPQKIAVISSPTAAGLGDFLDQLSSNRYAYHFEIKLFKALMQGNQAEESIVNAMLEVYQELEQKEDAYDVLVIIRGGGAQVDLDCFDGYDVAAHIAQFPIPVITGIGHERDETVADLVAHTRMKTPTAVAEFLINGILSFDEKLEGLWYRLTQKAQFTLKDNTYALDNLSNRLKFAANSILQNERHQLEQAQHQLQYYSRQQIKGEREKLLQTRKNLEVVSQKKLLTLKEKLNNYKKYLLASDPEHILKKGFTYSSVNGKPLQKVNAIEEGDMLETISFQKVLRSRVESIQNRQKHERQKEK